MLTSRLPQFLIINQLYNIYNCTSNSKMAPTELRFENDIKMTQIDESFIIKENNKITTPSVTMMDHLIQKENENKEKNFDKLYPNCDVNVWLRSCSNEVVLPLPGHVQGEVPKWLKGSLLRNGPGNLKFGDMTFQHLFDSSALLHRFCINEGKVTYQRRFLKTKTYKSNYAAQRIVVTEFGTKAVPDPCQSIFQRVSALFTPGESMSDNAMISVYPFGDEFYCFTESPIIHKIDPKTLETTDRINLSSNISIVNHTSHPHIMGDESVYNVGLSITCTGPQYSIVHFPSPKYPVKEETHMLERAKIVATIPCRWKLNPSYMHTFGITENYFIIVEQPLSVNVPSLLQNTLSCNPLIASLKWYDDELTQIYLVSREDGKCKYKFLAEAFFFLHIINCFDERNHCVLDICCYKDPKMLDCMYIESLKGAQKNPEYAKMFRGRPLRFVMPLEPPEGKFQPEEDLLRGGEALPWKTRATAHYLPDGNIFVTPEKLCDLGCETPRIHYERYLGRPYRYFYAISSDVDADNPGTIIKVDTMNQSRQTWSETNVYPSEPIFVPNPNPQSEDDGVVISAMVWGGNELENKVALLILDAKTFKEIGRASFLTEGPVPKCLHGWFAENVV